MAQDTSPVPPSGASSIAVDLSPEAIVSTNTLTRPGAVPFHLKLSFQVFNFAGQSADQGTVEYWWAGAAGNYVTVTSPLLGLIHNTNPNLQSKLLAGREVFLLQDLLMAVYAPAAALGKPSEHLNVRSQTVGKASLVCMQPPSIPAQLGPSAFTVCADTVTGTVRLMEEPNHQTTRNRVAHFGKYRVALDVTTSWEGTKAITGHIEQLESFDPKTASVPLEHAEAATAAQAAAPVLNGEVGVHAGKKISGAQPSYPPLARERHVAGTVILIAEISKEGKIEHLIPLASPDPLLTDAAIQAVGDWTYEPYRLNGQPTSVTTQVSINFNVR